MLAAVRFRVPPADAESFLPQAREALDALSRCNGFAGGSLGPATDDPELWLLVTRWRSIGDYRRGLGSYDVKLRAHPFLYLAIDEPTAFEELLVVEESGAATEVGTDRAPDAGTWGLTPLA